MIYSLYVAIGAFLGAISRYVVSRFFSKRLTYFPLGTLIVNVIGSFLLGLITAIVTSKSLLLLLGTGFMGAFTTFSTLIWECFQLRLRHEWKKLLLYILTTLGLGILFTWIGFVIGSLI